MTTAHRFFTVTALILACGGLGAEEPIPISSIEELQRIGNDADYPLDADYIVTQDIDASETAEWNDGEGFQPLGAYDPQGKLPEDRAFRGTLDGGDHAIAGLTINRPQMAFNAIFAWVGEEGVIRNLTLEDNNITARAYVAGFAAVFEGRMEGCRTTGSVTSPQDGERVGGLVAVNEGGVISESHTTGPVAGENAVGGLIGLNVGGEISDCSAAGAVSGRSGIGGLVGQQRLGALIRDSFASGDVQASAYLAGGLVGSSREDSVIENAYAEGDVMAGEGSAGGLAGGNGSEITSSFATGAVRVISGGAAGGLAGGNSGEITDSHATGNVTAEEGDNVGGLLGGNGRDALVSGCYATGDVFGTAFNTGGLIGTNQGAVAQCHASGAVEGGLVVGGLVGDNMQDGSIAECFATGDVTGTHGSGGLVGLNRGAVSDSYALGAVEGEVEATAGLVAGNGGTITRTYAAGPVTSEGVDLGGLVGQDANGTVEASFWDIDATGQSESEGGEGLGGEAMRRQAVFAEAGWDFDAIWAIDEGETYPYLAFAAEVEDDNGEDGHEDGDEDNGEDENGNGDEDNGEDEDEAVLGDVNGNGEVDARDIQIVINAVLGLPIPEHAEPDVNNDNEVDARDIQIVINVVLGVPISLE